MEESGMRRLAILLLLMLAVEVKAQEVLLIPEDNPRPTYPRSLQRAGFTGDVRVSFYVNADGSVNRVKILESDHPDLAEASKVTIEKWRFKPWVVKDDRPSELEVVAPLVFRLDLTSPIHTNQWIKELKCRDINEELLHAPEYAWIDARPFHYTRAYLSNVFHTTQLPKEQRLEWIAKLNKRVPTIVRQCRSSPVRKYMSLLPEEIRQLL
jgi:TonB family protein